MAERLRRAARVIDVRRVWVNPDCGLKTRAWEEVRPALEGMVRVARALRRELGGDWPDLAAVTRARLERVRQDR